MFMNFKGATVQDLNEEMERGDDSQNRKATKSNNTQDYGHKDDLEDNVTEQAHHIIISSYYAGAYCGGASTARAFEQQEYVQDAGIYSALIA